MFHRQLIKYSISPTMAPPTVDELIQRNFAHVGQYPDLSDLPERPKTAIISCSDPRVIPERIFHLDYREALVFRVVGGHPHTVFKNILAVDSFLGLNEIMIIHHTDCGIRFYTEDDVKNSIRKLEVATEEEIRDLGSFGTLSQEITEEQSVQDDVHWLKSQKMLRPKLAEHVRGLVLNVTTGVVKEIEC